MFSNTGISLFGFDAITAETPAVRALVVLFSASLFLWLPLFSYCGVAIGRSRSYTLILVAALFFSCFVIIITRSFFVLFVALECTAFSTYALAGMRVTLRTALSGFLYTLLGSLTTVLFVIAIATSASFSGSFSYSALANALASFDVSTISIQPLLVIAVVLFSCVFLFKLAASPFQSWSIEVYGEAPLTIVALFGSIVKFAVFAAFIRVVSSCFLPVFDLACRPTIVFSACLSLLIGGIAGLVQSRIKRLLAYSSVFHMGYVLVGLSLLSSLYVVSLIISIGYLFVYILTFLGTFISLNLVTREPYLKGPLIYIADLSILRTRSVFHTLCLIIFFFSFLGLPPLGGFFIKFSIFYALIGVGNVLPALGLVVLTVVSSFYYLRVIYLSAFSEIASVDRGSYRRSQHAQALKYSASVLSLHPYLLIKTGFLLLSSWALVRYGFTIDLLTLTFSRVYVFFGSAVGVIVAFFTLGLPAAEYSVASFRTLEVFSLVSCVFLITSILTVVPLVCLII